ncbi:MAG TPA: hypothetical protein VGM01_01400 [Ktedonobacteraceae bacterium]|jgi:hypothetical protein
MQCPNCDANLFSCWQILTTGFLWAIWQHAVSKTRQSHEHRLLKRDIPSQRRKRLSRILLINPLLFMGLAVISVWTPILTPIYLAAYLVGLAVTWSVSHWSSHRGGDLLETDSTFDPQIEEWASQRILTPLLSTRDSLNTETLD